MRLATRTVECFRWLVIVSEVLEFELRFSRTNFCDRCLLEYRTTILSQHWLQNLVLVRAAGPLNNSPTEDDGQNTFPTRTRRARGRGRGGNSNANRGNMPGVLLPTALLRTAWKEYRDKMSKVGNYIPGWKKGDNWTRYLIHTSSVSATVVSSVGVSQLRAGDRLSC